MANFQWRVRADFRRGQLTTIDISQYVFAMTWNLGKGAPDPLYPLSTTGLAVVSFRQPATPLTNGAEIYRRGGWLTIEVRKSSTGNWYRMWTGFIRSVVRKVRNSGTNSWWEIIADSAFSQLREADHSIYLADLADLRSDIVVKNALDRVARIRAGQDQQTGTTTWTNWQTLATRNQGQSIISPLIKGISVFGNYYARVKTMVILEAIMRAEMGFLRDNRQGNIQFESRHFRLQPANTMKLVGGNRVPITIPDGAIRLRDAVLHDPQEFIYNIFSDQLTTHSTSANQSIKTGYLEQAPNWDTAVSLPANHTTFIPIALEVSRVRKGQYFTNIAITSTSSPSGSVTATYIPNTQTSGNIKLVTGSTAGSITITDITSTFYIVLGDTFVRQRNQDSITVHGEREYSIPSTLIVGDDWRDKARQHATALAEVYGWEQNLLEGAIVVTDDSYDAILDMTVSKLVKLPVSRLGLTDTQQFFVEQESHEVDGRTNHWTARYQLSDANRIEPFLREGSLWGKDSKVFY